MSDSTNDLLLDRASDMIEYWEGTLHADLIRQALDSNDLDQVRTAVANAEGEVARQQIYGYDLIPEQGDIY